MLKASLWLIASASVVIALCWFFSCWPERLLLPVNSNYFHLSNNVFESPQIVYTHSYDESGTPLGQIVLADSPKYHALVLWMKENIGPQLSKVAIQRVNYEAEATKDVLTLYSRCNEVFKVTDNYSVSRIGNYKAFETSGSGCFMSIPLSCESLDCSEQELQSKIKRLYEILNR